MNKKIYYFQWAIIIVFFVLLLLLVMQNVAMKKNTDSAGKHSVEVDALLFSSYLENNFLFKNLPITIEKEDLYFPGGYDKDSTGGHLVMVFDLTVCGKCLHDGLAVLNTFKDVLIQKNISVLGIVGLTDKSEEAQIISLHRVGEISFPVKTIEVDAIYRAFKLSTDSYIDTPFFLYTTNSFQVIDIFKQVYLKTEELQAWLELIADQEIPIGM